MNNKIGLSGRLSINHMRNGQLVNSVAVPNTIMNVGKSVISSFIGSDISTGVAFDYMSIGTSGLAAAATQTTLGSEQVRVNTVASQTTKTTTNDTATFIGSFVITGTHSIVEAGVFNAASTGSMLARTTFGAISVVSGDSINATWAVTVA